MDPSVKFVSAIIDAFSNNKMGVSVKKPKRGEGRGGAEGGLIKDKDKEHVMD